MDLEELKKIVEKTKKNLLTMTYYLDNLESTYNKILKEYQKRKNGAN
jgi:hypothetical protein